ncbi:MAG: T9SS type A sorting domain-containing protein [Candidatus Eisenbacteria sp.]|nr:T9SS type A sorting domain-containing protein [Candidatus Eisenbacteria bacterium]
MHLRISIVLRAAFLLVVGFSLFAPSPMAETAMIAESFQGTATERNNARLIVEDALGIIHVVYYSDGIYHCTSDNGGQDWSYPLLISSIGRNPSLAIDLNNTLQLVYRSGLLTAYDIVHRSYDGAWSDPAVVHHTYVNPVSRPVIAVDPENNLHCVWQQAGAGAIPNSEIWYKKHTPATGWSDGGTNISSTYGASEYPTLAIDADGDLYAFWKDSGEDIGNDKMVLHRKYAAGVGWDAEYTNVSNTSGNGSYATMDPCAVIDSQGNVHLVWSDSQVGNREIFYKRCTGGVWDTTPANISNSATSSRAPTLSLDDQDRLHLAWAEKMDGVYCDVLYRMCESGTGTWTDTENLSNSEHVDSEHPNGPVRIGDSLRMIWTEGEGSPYAVVISRSSAADANEAALPDQAGNWLWQSRRNPFNPPGTISYAIPQAGNVTIEIYDLTGQRVRRLHDGYRLAGVHQVTWDGRNGQAGPLASGIYLCRIVSGTRASTGKICLVE